MTELNAAPRHAGKFKFINYIYTTICFSFAARYYVDIFLVVEGLCRR